MVIWERDGYIDSGVWDHLHSKINRTLLPRRQTSKGRSHYPMYQPSVPQMQFLVSEKYSGADPGFFMVFSLKNILTRSQLNQFENLFGAGVPLQGWVGFCGEVQCIKGNGHTSTSPY